MAEAVRSDKPEIALGEHRVSRLILGANPINGIRSAFQRFEPGSG